MHFFGVRTAERQKIQAAREIAGAFRETFRFREGNLD
jgi:hypothetical protein